jgi:hypothetical protein
VRAVTVLVVATALTLMISPANAQFPCRGYPPGWLMAELKGEIEALRRIEREAADRLLGLDTRSYEWLLQQARAINADIAKPLLLALEADLKRCRNFIRPVRRRSAVCASALVQVLQELVAGDATSEAKAAYAQVMPECERMLGLTPLATSLRAPP